MLCHRYIWDFRYFESGGFVIKIGVRQDLHKGQRSFGGNPVSKYDHVTKLVQCWPRLLKSYNSCAEKGVNVVLMSYLPVPQRAVSETKTSLLTADCLLQHILYRVYLKSL